jgi:SAM-dependent methyltransferase
MTSRRRMIVTYTYAKVQGCETDNLEFKGTISSCKICKTDAPIHGVVDFNKCCDEYRGTFLPLSGVPIYYHKCSECGLIFTNAFDKWDKSEFLEHIYNEEYIKVDPDYIEDRPLSFSSYVYDFIKKGENLKIVDYGGGNGRMSQLLTAKGVYCKSWDPMEITDYMPPEKTFDLATAFEVFEHTPTPLSTTEQALSFLNDNGVLLFSTLTIDSLSYRDVGFWYIAPRNGHVTIYSKKSLEVLFGKFGFHVHHYNDGMHLAFRNIPNWLL